jgi:hypothetical protein
MAEDAKELAVPALKAGPALTLDGLGADALWSKAALLPALKFESGEAEDSQRASRIQVAQLGTVLLFGFDADEPDGVYAREGTHGSDLWFDDAFGVELKGASSCTILVNSFGSLWCSRDGKTDFAPIAGQQIQSAAHVAAGHWRTEVALDLRLLGKDGALPSQASLHTYRQRQVRGMVPFEEPGTQLTLRLAAVEKDAAEVQIKSVPPQRFVDPVPIEALRCAAAPADDAAWSKVPATVLRNESGNPPFDDAFQKTTVRCAVTPDALILQIACSEAFPETMVTEKELWQQDELEIFVGPEGFNFLQLACNSKGDQAAVRGKTGGKNPKGIPVPEGVRVQAGTKPDGWMVTLNIPIEAVRAAAPFPKSLGFENFPWRVQVLRNRPDRPAIGQAAQTSVLAVTRSATAHCPQRFALLQLTDTAAVAPIAAPLEMPAPVLSAEQRKQLKAPSLLQEWLSARTKEFQRVSEEQFAKVDSPDAWKAYAAKVRERLMQSIFAAGNGKLPERTPLNDKIVFTHKGDGFRVEGLVFESRPGLPVAATVYAPDAPPAAGQLRPVLLMIPAHHTPRNSLDLQIVGMTLARNGCVALATEPLGSGERSVSALWEHKSYQCNEIGAQLTLAGEDLAGWTAFDVSRAVDYLLARGDIDPKRLGIMGGVAGGGDISALAAALDERFTVSIPFNFNTAEPFGGYWDPTRTYVGAHAGGYSAWTTDALFAPRCQIMAQEFSWGKECQDRYARFQKLYSLLGVEQNLAFVHGGEQTHATHFNVMHRIPVYKILNKWWGTALPETDAGEYKKKSDEGSLECFTPPEGRKWLSGVRAAGRLAEPQAIALAQSTKLLAAAREQRQKSGRALRDDLSKLIKDTTPLTPGDGLQSTPRDPWHGFNVEALWLPAEPNAKLGLAMWLISPKDTARRPLVLGVAQGGKARFLADRSAEIEKLLNSGVAVALLDVRGCGETSPGDSRYPEGPSITLATVSWMQDESLPARQLKDVLTALRYLAGRKDVDAERIGLWGDGLTPANGKAGEAVLFDETGFRQVSPTPKNLAEPLGGFLAMSAALYPIDANGKAVRVRAVLARGALVSYASVLERRYFYIPQDAIVPGILNVADMSDIAAELRKDKIALLAEDLRDGNNRAITAERVEQEWQKSATVPPANGAAAALASALTK